MRIAVFGGTGPTGRLVIERALSQGDEVVAFARDTTKLPTGNQHLTVVRGQLTDDASIERTIAGADLVISTLGPRARQKGQPIAAGMSKIVAAMRRQGVRRMVITSTASASDPLDRAQLKFRLLVGVIRTFARDAYEDVVATARVVRDSDLDWTITRLALLKNGPAKGKVRTGYTGRGEIGTSVVRADLAAFVLDEAKHAAHLHQAPMVTN
jgi:putative NADH-flavin reductase